MIDPCRFLNKEDPKSAGPGTEVRVMVTPLSGFPGEGTSMDIDSFICNIKDPSGKVLSSITSAITRTRIV